VIILLLTSNQYILIISLLRLYIPRTATKWLFPANYFRKYKVYFCRDDLLLLFGSSVCCASQCFNTPTKWSTVLHTYTAIALYRQTSEKDRVIIVCRSCLYMFASTSICYLILLPRLLLSFAVIFIWIWMRYQMFYDPNCHMLGGKRAVGALWCSLNSAGLGTSFFLFGACLACC
jgi:hypothetical protein